jgi:hypothetical protein
MKIKLGLVNDQYNLTDIESFEILIKGDEVLVSKKPDKIQGTSMNDTETPEWLVSMDVDAAPSEVEEMRFEATHNAFIKDAGERTRRNVSGSTDVSVQIPEENVTSFSTNASEIRRGKKLFVAGKVDKINRLNVSGVSATMEGQNFSAWVEVPLDLSKGRQQLDFTIRTGRGNTFRRSLTINVLNNPPTLTVDYPETLQRGDNFTLQADAQDDRAVQAITWTFNGDKIPFKGNTTSMNISDLSPGTYNFTVTASDDEGGKRTVNGSFRVQEETVQQETPTEAENKNDEKKAATPESIPVMRKIRNLIQGSIKAVIGLLGQ